MTIEIINSCLLQAFDSGEVNIIAHCCNSQGVMGSGIALAIKQRYPQAFEEYKEHLAEYNRSPTSPLGSINPVKLGMHQDGWRDKKVYNIIGQEFYGRDKRYVNYGALSQGFCAMTYGLTGKRDDVVMDYDTIGMPYLIGCGTAKGSEEVILEMLEFYFKDFDLRIYKLC
jgi:hypothetical protein